MSSVNFLTSYVFLDILLLKLIFSKIVKYNAKQMTKLILKYIVIAL